VLKFCPNMTDDYAMADCLQNNAEKLTSICHQALENQQ
jgi:hypothetical protein